MLFLIDAASIEKNTRRCFFSSVCDSLSDGPGQTHSREEGGGARARGVRPVSGDEGKNGEDGRGEERFRERKSKAIMENERVREKKKKEERRRREKKNCLTTTSSSTSCEPFFSFVFLRRDSCDLAGAPSGTRFTFSSTR
jgi:hypothetical protein